MDVIKRLRQAIDILTFRRSTIRAVADDPSAFLPGLSFVVLFGFIGRLSFGIPAVASLTVRVVIISFLMTGILYLVALLFKGRGRFLDLWKPLAFTSVLDFTYLLLFLPRFHSSPPAYSVVMVARLLVYAVAVYRTVVSVVVVETVMALRRGTAVAVILIAFLVVPALPLHLLSLLTEGHFLAPYIYSIF